jgi:ATP-dependent DNA helicase RecG
MSILPINLDSLLSTTESVRLELKAAWSEQTLDQIMRTICAFANDFQELNGGYIIIGIREDENHRPILPPEGLENTDIDEIQQTIRGQCKRIEPEYYPVISPEVYHGKLILVIWCPGGDNRPYQAPPQAKSGDREYYVRLGSATVEAKGEVLTQLMQKTAKLPFDARRNQAYGIDIISPSLVRSFLFDIKSDWSISNGIQERDLYRQLGISAPVNGHDVPRNIALLFFVDDPEKYFPGARIDVVQYGDEGDLLEERIFRGPLHVQLRQTLDYLDNLSTKMIKKVPGQAEAKRTVAFPYDAMREALVNAVYHRSYEGTPDPTQVRLYPDRMEIISYPGPMPGIELTHFQRGASVPPVPNRNRLIGNFLKDLKLAEGRGTGIPKIRRTMRENGSPEPTFYFTEDRSYFQVTLPAHPQYLILYAIRESARLWAIGERQKAIRDLEETVKRVSSSGTLMAQIIEYKAALGDILGAEQTFKMAEHDPLLSEKHLVYVAMARAFLDSQNIKQASEVLSKAPSTTQVDEIDIVELAILYKRAGDLTKAHKVFEASYAQIKNDPKAVHEYAQTKMQLAGKTGDIATRNRLNREAVELLRRCIQLSDDNTRRAWAYYHLAQTLNWLGVPETEIADAYHRAVEILPNESRFSDWYQRRKKRN